MAIILNIDTAVDNASICLSDNDKIAGMVINESRKDHASWLHNAIRDLVLKSGLQMNDLSAVAVSIGPGSYTGLRLGLTAAKGLCYALHIPLITVNTLKMMAYSVRKEVTDLVCPVIDARRMEVFTAVYNTSFEEIMKPSAVVVDKQSFSDIVSSHRVIFCGNGTKKLQSILSHTNAIFSSHVATAADMVYFASNYHSEKNFADLAYCEPFYIKEFYSPHINF